MLNGADCQARAVIGGMVPSLGDQRLALSRAITIALTPGRQRHAAGNYRERSKRFLS
jgi:hypothetical protein